MDPIVSIAGIIWTVSFFFFVRWLHPRLFRENVVSVGRLFPLARGQRLIAQSRGKATLQCKKPFGVMLNTQLLSARLSNPTTYTLQLPQVVAGDVINLPLPAPKNVTLSVSPTVVFISHTAWEDLLQILFWCSALLGYLAGFIYIMT